MMPKNLHYKPKEEQSDITIYKPMMLDSKDIKYSLC